MKRMRYTAAFSVVLELPGALACAQPAKIIKMAFMYSNDQSA